MSWLSIPFKSLQFDQNEEETQQNDDVSSPGGVKEDLTAIGESIGRQFRAFLSPETSNSGENGGGGGGSGGSTSYSSRTFEGVLSDLEEIKGTFKSSLSIFSSNSNNAVNEISKLASNFLKFNDDEIDVGYVNGMISKVNDGNYGGKDDDHGDGDDDDDDDDVSVGVGVDDEVIEFAQQISNRSELWTEFPLSFDYEFELSEAQYEHVSVIEQLVPSLADLKSRIRSDKSEKQFWMIYFILLLPRLHEEDTELLSTPETVEARETLLKMLRAKKNNETDPEKPRLDGSSDTDNEVHKTSISNESNQSDPKPENIDVSFVIEKHGRNDNQEEEKHVISESSAAGASKQFQSEDDVSFSDLEDDDNDLSNRRLRSGPSQSTRTSSPEGSNDWVRLNKNVEDKGNQVKGESGLRERDSEGEDSTGWLTVDDFDP